MALEFNKQIFEGLINDLIENKNNLKDGSDQAAHWLVANFMDCQSEFCTINENDTIDFTFACIYYNNLLNAVINNDYDSAETNLILLAEVFEIPPESIDKYLNAIFNDEEEVYDCDVYIEVVSHDGASLSPWKGMSDNLVKEIMEELEKNNNLWDF